MHFIINLAYTESILDSSSCLVFITISLDLYSIASLFNLTSEFVVITELFLASGDGEIHLDLDLEPDLDFGK